MSDRQDNAAHGYRRRFARRPVELPATVRAGSSELTAVAENISPGGAFLNLALPAAVTELVASIQLPHGRQLHVRAKVRWRRQVPPGVGIQFEIFLQAPQDPERRRTPR